MALYSLNAEDSVKVSVKFPADSSVDKFYDLVTEIRDLAGNVIVRTLPNNYITRTEIIVPKCTFNFIQKPSMKHASKLVTITPNQPTTRTNTMEKYLSNMKPILILFQIKPTFPQSKMP